MHSGVENRRQLREEGQLAALLDPSNGASRVDKLLQTLSCVAEFMANEGDALLPALWLSGHPVLQQFFQRLLHGPPVCPILR